jgi:hypothetical protein
MAKKLDSFRVFHGATADPQIALIAVRHNLPRATVLGLWLALQECASSSTPRGSLKACNPDYLAITLGLTAECVHTLISDMARQKILDPAQGFCGWLKKQQHSSERVRHFRARKSPEQKPARRPHHDDPNEIMHRRARLSPRQHSTSAKE